MIRNRIEWLQFGFECFESVLNGWNLDLNASNSFRMVGIWIRMLRNRFEWFKLAFECFNSVSNGSNLISNRANPFRMVRI